MSNKRQKKKQAKGTPMTASQISTPNTNMKEAMTKAKTEVKPANNSKPKATPESKPESRKIIGVGSANKGAIIHAITNRDNGILCDTRRTNYLVDVTLAPSQVNCVKCQKFKSFERYLELKAPKKVEETVKGVVEKTVKELVSKMTKPKQPVKKVEPEKPVEKETAKSKIIAPPKVNIDMIPPGQEPDEFEALKTLMDIRFKRLKTHLNKVIVNMVKEELGKMPEWFIARKSNGRFQIIHEKSRYVFTDNITQEQAEELVVRYSEIPIQWDGATKIPPAFIKSVKKIHAEVLNSANEKEPKKRKTIKPKKRKSIGVKHFPTSEKPKRVRIKRRSK